MLESSEFPPITPQILAQDSDAVAVDYVGARGGRFHVNGRDGRVYSVDLVRPRFAVAEVDLEPFRRSCQFVVHNELRRSVRPDPSAVLRAQVAELMELVDVGTIADDQGRSGSRARGQGGRPPRSQAKLTTMLHLREHCVELWTLADLAEEFFGSGYIDAAGAAGAALRRFKKQHPELIAHCVLCNSDENCRPPGHLETSRGLMG